MSTNPYSAYDTAVTTADPVTLTTMLFDGAVKAIRKARIHFEAKNRESFLLETNRAYLIIGELLATLDLDQGDLPRQLSGIYTYCMRLLIQATPGDASKLDEVERHIVKIGESWKEATAALKASTPAAPFGEAAA
ncbi:MAG: flagellar export chaperone FliS [Anaerolinea sp.]|nr:flagellar export chaperone FliS [Anaerolinea sp.]